MQIRFASMDRQASAVAQYAEPLSSGSLAELAASGPLIARGAGLSYVGASFGSGARSIGMHRLDGILALDERERRVRVQAGISLGALHDYLLPFGLYLPIQPGHPQITVGACIACNVHGKNPQRDGLFWERVEELELFHPRHGTLRLSRQERPDLFELTCGGLGLTGIIVSVTLRLSPIPTQSLELEKLPVANLTETCERILEAKDRYDFLYSWNDLSTFGAALGRGYLAAGRFIEGTAATVRPLGSYRRLDPTASAQRWRPQLFRGSVISALSRLQLVWKMWQPTERVSLSEVLYPGVRWNFYFDLYGAAGFFGHMVLLPLERWRDYVARLERIMRAHREPILVTSMKTFAGQQRLLHFNGRGISMHFHVPNTPGGKLLIGAMDELSLELQVIRNLYFDARLSGRAAAGLYPEYESFRQRLLAFDPERLFQSELSRRLEL